MSAYADVESLLIDWAKTALGYQYVTDEVPTNLVNLVRTDPVIVVERFGGADAVITLDVARVDIDVFANSRAGAKEHAKAIRTAVRTRLVNHIYSGTVVSKVETISAPTHAAWDSRNTLRRFTQAVQITLHQFSGVS